MFKGLLEKEPVSPRQASGPTTGINAPASRLKKSCRGHKKQIPYFTKQFQALVNKYNERDEKDVLRSEVLEGFLDEMIEMIHALQSERGGDRHFLSVPRGRRIGGCYGGGWSWGGEGWRLRATRRGVGWFSRPGGGDGTWKEVSGDVGEGQIPARHPDPVVVVVAPDLALRFEDRDVDVHFDLRVVVPDPFDGRFQI